MGIIPALVNKTSLLLALILITMGIIPALVLITIGIIPAVLNITRFYLHSYSYQHEFYLHSKANIQHLETHHVETLTLNQRGRGVRWAGGIKFLYQNFLSHVWRYKSNLEGPLDSWICSFTRKFARIFFNIANNETYTMDGECHVTLPAAKPNVSK